MSDLLVEYHGATVGRAIAEGEEFAFEYDADWLTRDDSFPISLNLPCRRDRWPANRAHPFFANLLPEGRAREAVSRKLGVSPDSDVDLLNALGDDTAGAFRFVPTSDDRRSAQGREPISREDLQDWAEGAAAFSTDPERPPRLSLAGAQHKTSVVTTENGFAVPANGEPSTHILKFESSDFPHLTANEYLTTRFAENLGLNTVDCRLDDRTSPPILVVERYDRHATDNSVRRLHQEDFCQILGLPPSRKYEQPSGPALDELATAIRRHSSRPAADILELIRWVIVCAIAGNADGHAKNISMLYAPDGLTLAPAYDLVCTRAYPHLHTDLAFSVGGERNPDSILQDNWSTFAEQIDVRPRLVFQELERILKDAEDAFTAACDDLRDHLGDSHAIQHVQTPVHKRLRAIRSHL